MTTSRVCENGTVDSATLFWTPQRHHQHKDTHPYLHNMSTWTPQHHPGDYNVILDTTTQRHPGLDPGSR